MAGTREGGLKTAKANKKRYGRNWYKKIGKSGGLAKVPKGFAFNRELASLAGTKGGRISKRGPAR